MPAHAVALSLQAAFSNLGMNLSAFGVDVDICNAAGSTVSGQYLQASSQFPGKGPCYPVWASTVPYFNRYVHASRSSARAKVFSSVQAGPGQLVAKQRGPTIVGFCPHG